MRHPYKTFRIICAPGIYTIAMSVGQMEAHAANMNVAFTLQDVEAQGPTTATYHRQAVEDMRSSRRLALACWPDQHLRRCLLSLASGFPAVAWDFYLSVPMAFILRWQKFRLFSLAWPPSRVVFLFNCPTDTYRARHVRSCIRSHCAAAFVPRGPMSF